jgi:hypothetical protein
VRRFPKKSQHLPSYLSTLVLMRPTYNTRIKKISFWHIMRTKCARGEGHINHLKILPFLLKCNMPMLKRLHHGADVGATTSAAVLAQQPVLAPVPVPAPARAPVQALAPSSASAPAPAPSSAPAPLSAPGLSSAPSPAPSSAPVPEHLPGTRYDLCCIAIAGASLSAISSPKCKQCGTSSKRQAPALATESAAASALAPKPMPLPARALLTQRKQHPQLQRCVLQGPGNFYYFLFATAVEVQQQLQQQRSSNNNSAAAAAAVQLQKQW